MSHGQTIKVNVGISMYLHESWADNQGKCRHKYVLTLMYSCRGISTLVCFIQKERIHWWKEFTVHPTDFFPSYDEIPDYSNST